MEKTVLFLIASFAVLIAGIQDTPQYILTVPSNLWSGENFKYCVMSVGAKASNNSNDEIVFSFDLLDKDMNKTFILGEKTLSAGKFSSCFEMKAPKNVGFYSMTVSQFRKIKLPGVDSLEVLEKEYKTNIQVLKSSGREITLIQTDRPMYKPGQTVKFRIMKLDKDFRPTLGPIPLVVVENPTGVRVMQWRNEELKNGIASFEMPLSNEPPTGVWTIKATFDSVEKQTFEVKEYVLPKFEVTINPPPFLLPSSPTIDGEICAKYTYGKPVKGTAEIKICYRSTYFGFYGRDRFKRPCAKLFLVINGCQTFSLNSSEVFLSSSRYSRYGQLQINATVTEYGTGVILTGNSVGPKMSFDPFQIKMEDDTDSYYKGVFPYRGRVTATKPDGSPAVGELIEIDAKEVTRDLTWGVRKNFTTDNDGKFSFAVENIPENVTGFYISARAPLYVNDYSQSDRHSLYQPRSSHFVRRWYSPTDSYIQIEDVPEPVKCGEKLNLSVLYSTPPDTKYTFQIMVMSGYEVVYTSHHSHHFKIHDAVDFDKVSKVDYLEEYKPKPWWRPEPPRPPIIIENNATLEANTTDQSNPEPEPVDEAIIQPEALLPLTRPEKRDAERCIDFKGNEVQDGVIYKPSIKEPCESCFCDKGRKRRCSIASCMPPSCKKYEVIQGECCAFKCLDGEPVPEEIQSPPPPPGNCVDFKGIEVQDGELYKPDIKEPCKSCVCEKERQGREERCFTAMCMPPSCKKYEMIPGECCGFKCLDDKPVPEEIQSPPPPPAVNCTDNTGTVYNDGDFYTPNKSKPCEQCFCTKGKPDGCQMIYCDEPPCPNYELIKGTCCGFKCLTVPVPVPPTPQPRPPPVLSTHIARVQLHIPISAVMAPDARILLYYVKEDEETVATSRDLVIEKCLDNKVNMKFSKASVKPGSQTTVNIQAANGSLCSVAVVDKSIDLLKADHRLTKEKLYNKINKGWGYRYWYDNNEYCRKKVGDSRPKDPNVHYHGPSFDRNIVDALEAFSSSNLLVFSNVEIETRPCIKQEVSVITSFAYESQPMPMARENVLVGQASVKLSSPKKLRSFFPETWLWELETVDDRGELTINKELPDTITEWKGNSVCLSPVDGIGISPVASITAFQPFFLSFTLPYSAVRGEIVPVVITVFNYMPQCLVMNITLQPSHDFRLENTLSPRVNTQCICGGNSDSTTYYIVPYTLGKINITASAESIPDDGTCGNSVVSTEGTGISDAVIRSLIIKAEGIEKDYTYSSYICPSESEGMIASGNIELPLPLNSVKDSARGIINVIGDVMGPALANLQDLVRMPYGCGEQNAASFSPNIFVLQYFNKTNQAIASVVNEAKNNMRVGYQRQLRYRHSDGSYSAWGGDSGSGSMWLTAFVVKCFGQARKYIYIDEEDLQTSIVWFRRRQLENGCFPKVGYTHSYYLKGGFAERSNDALMTAFVMIAMLEAGVPRDGPAVLNAVRCLDIQKIKDTYTLTVLAYAYTLFDVTHTRRQEVMDMLELRAQKKDGMMFWERQKDENEATESPTTYYRAPSAEVEMTAYALLAFVVGDEDSVAVKARPIVLWLSKQRNANGGFSSTQDTIIALQALSIYASLVYQGGIDLTVNVNGDKIAKSFGISNENNLVLQTAPFDVIPNNLSLNIRGVGCALIQAEVKYNIPDESSNLLTFSLKVGVYRSKIEPNNCKRRTLNICVKYVGAGGLSNMAIVDVNMQTGWIPDKTSLKTLLKSSKNNSLGLERYETDGKVVHLYFDKLDNLFRCFYFDVEQNIKVSNPKPAFVEVYDYYETDMRKNFKYDIKTTCGTKEELPVISVEEYLDGIINTPPDRIVQVRVPIGAIDLLPQPGPVKVTCPVCKQIITTKGPEFDDLVCKSRNIYKARFTGSNGKYTMKMYADLKPRRKESIKLFANHVMADTCNCTSLVEEKKVMIFTEKDIYTRDAQKVNLNNLSTIVSWSKRFERAVFRKNKRC